jgi:hypothetical protein
VNGRRFDYTSILAKVDGLPLVGRAFTSVNYDDGLEPGVVTAGSPLPLGLTRGVYKAQGSLELPKEEADLFITALAVTAGGTGSVNGYMEARFELTVEYAEALGKTQIDHLNGCRVTHVSDAHAKGGEGLVTKFDLFIQYIVRNGKFPLGLDAMIK